MKNFKIIIPFILLFWGTALSAGNQEVWSLEDCINYAIINNIQIKKSDIILSRTNEDVLQSKMDYLPSVSVNADQSFNWGRSVDMQELVVIKNKLNSSLSLSASVSIPIIDGFSKIFNSKLSKVEVKIAKSDKEDILNNLRINIIETYLELLLAKELHMVAVLEFENVKKQVERAARLVEVGRQPQSSLYELQTKLAESQVQVIETRWQIETDKTELEHILELPFGTIIDIPEYNIDSIPTVDFTAEEEQPLPYPSVEKARLNYNKALIEYKMHKAKLLPVIGVSLGYMTYYSSTGTDKFKSQLKSNVNPTIGISLQIPLFDRYMTVSQIKKSKLNVSYAALELRQKELEHQNDRKRVSDLSQKYFETIEALEGNIKSAEGALAVSQQKFENGIATALDYISAQNAHTKALSLYYRNAVQYIFQLKILDCYQGKKLKL